MVEIIQHRGVTICLAVCLFILGFTVTGTLTISCPSFPSITEETDDGEATATVSWVTPDNFTCNQTSGEIFPVGENFVQCQGGSDMCIFTITVNDNEDPEISCPQTRTISTDSGRSTKSFDWTIPRGTDNVGIAGSTCTPPPRTAYGIGTESIQCEVSDTAGNKATCTWHITVEDDEPPSLINCPEGKIRVASSAFDPSVDSSSRVAATWEEPAAEDNSGEAVTIMPTHSSGELFPPGSTTVMYTATDKSANTADCSFDVVVFVLPPDDHIFIESTTTESMESCVTAVWPESNDQTVEDYSIYFWRVQTEMRPDASGRRIAPANKVNTYTREEFCSLIPGELYQFEVESGSNIRRVQQWTMPNPPGSLEVVQGTLSTTSATLSWVLSSQNVEQYYVQLPGKFYYVSRKTDRIVVDSLQPGRSFFMSLYAVVGSGSNRLRSSRTISVLTTVSPRADEIIPYNVTETTIEVAWLVTDELASTVEPFMLFIDPSPEDQPNYEIVFTPNDGIGTALFEGLEPNTDYSIRLISNIGVSLTTQQKTRPGRVSNLRPTAVTSNSITLAWDPPKVGSVDSYRVYISPSETVDPVTQDGTSITFDSLIEKTEYFFRVFACNADVTSVVQSIMITAGLTEPGPAPPVEPALIVACLLGGVVLVLSIIIIVMCIRNRRNQMPERAGKNGTTNTAVVTEDELVYDYELTEVQRQKANNLNKSHSYQNTQLGSRPVVPGKPNKKLNRETEHVYEAANS